MSPRFRPQSLFLFCCSFDSIQQFHELFYIFQCPQIFNAVYWSFFLQPLADDDTNVPDLGKGFIQSLVSTDPHKLQCIHSIERLWRKHPQFRLQKLCDLISDMSEDVGECVTCHAGLQAIPRGRRGGPAA